MIEIDLRNSSKCALIDDVDADLAPLGWSLNDRYADRKIRADGTTVYVRLHIEVANRALGPVPFGKEVDHISGDTLDNRRENLRYATKLENSLNTRAATASFSKYKGVTWSRQHKQWRAKANLNGKYYHLGLFKDERAAARAYDTWARANHGEFRCVNFPLEGGRLAADPKRRAKLKNPA